MLEVQVKRRQGEFFIDAEFRSDGAGVTALFGRSGAGKTSIINMVAGLARPDDGLIVVNGRCLFDSRQGIDVPPHRRRMGYVFQDGRLFPHLSVRSNLAYGMHRTPIAERYVEFDRVVELLGLEHLLARRPAKLSGGEKQRVAIGRALLTSPTILLMDEPLASLDQPRKAEVLPFIARLASAFGVPILYVSHSLDEILNLADRMVILDGGRTVATGAIDDLAGRRDWQQLTGHTGRGAVLNTVVERHDDALQLTELSFAGGVLTVRRLDLPAGGRVRVLIHPRDVAVALERPVGISVQNIFPATVEELAGNGSWVDVRLDIGCPLLARITRRAGRELALEPGRRVFALVKSVAVSMGGLERVDGER